MKESETRSEACRSGERSEAGATIRISASSPEWLRTASRRAPGSTGAVATTRSFFLSIPFEYPN